MRPPPLPTGFGLVFDRHTRQVGPAALTGGAPARLLRLSPAGCRALAELRTGRVRSRAGGVLARLLCDAGLAHPRPPQVTGRLDATVIVPVKDDAASLDRCLGALGRDYPVLVVDDGSRAPQPIAMVAAAHGATLLRRDRCGGPGAARDTGLSRVDSELVVLVDSDCAPPPGWIRRLAAHLADPLVAVAAPRVVAQPRPLPPGSRLTALQRYHAAAGSLDLGWYEAQVVPRTPVAYVPTAALVLRRAALAEVARDGAVFDPALRYGEDVDLVWRLHAAGWRIRYDPSVRVPHRQPRSWAELLSRRFRYGTSAPDLAVRHPGAVPPLVVDPLPVAAVAALLLRRPALAVAAVAAAVVRADRARRRGQVAPGGVVGAVSRGLGQTWLGLGRYGAQFAVPALVAALLAGGRGRGRQLARTTAAALLVAPGLHAWATRSSSLDPARHTLAALADSAAYGAGVWHASVRRRTPAALIPALRRSARARTTRR
ncbi:mycofactocin biosynthesis glycosyltransferase MftF [Catellatospora tritici]|uniref:mycofactocin biosynthesis glycosyltransferase MftF n=1 Tax=Catellatospora tritici TaxID=2851566 RepID=UPI001C2D981C|nr:mycofactocin biosynthesis glycosyltransferase MftF [Catellatospora tritici]MBV1855110.1 mycofactocin biosynthesis glycosyltransferase MftF [Catellatospora tritici]